MLALGAAVWLASHALRAARGGGFSLGALAALSLAAAVALCSFWGGALRGSMAYAEAQGGDSAPATWHAELTEDARRGDFGWHAEARLRGADGRVLRMRLNLPEDAALVQGQSMTVSGTLKPPAEAVAAYYWDAGLAGSLTASESAFASEEAALDSGPFVHLRRCALDLIAACGGDNAPLLQALVCGWRPAIEESGLYDCFKAVGLAHLVAVSGAHLSIVVLFVAGGLKLLRLGRKATTVASALFLVGYVAFTGMPVSALRAAVMAATGLFALWANRRNSALSALGLCLLLFVGGGSSLRPFGLLRLVGGIHPGNRSIRTAAVLGLRGAPSIEEGRGRSSRPHRLLGPGDAALCGGALLSTAAPVAVGQPGSGAAVFLGVPRRVRRRTARMPCPRCVTGAHRRGGPGMRPALGRR